MAGQLTTHVLDTARGCPADNLMIELWFLEFQVESRSLLKTAITNEDGRTDGPLLEGKELSVGIYELTFLVGKYFRHIQPNLPTPLFLDVIPIRFGVSNPNDHYHVPLLVSPWAYSTYRGS
jgi:5-hydroxyisourate hydrolase